MPRKITSILGALAALLLLPGAAFAQSIITSGGSSSSGGSGPFTQSCATVSVSQPCLDLTTTWATTGTYVGAIRLNVTDSGPANAASLLVDLQVGGASKFRVDKSGLVSLVKGGNFNGSTVSIGEGAAAANGIVVWNAGYVGFSSTALSTGTPDVLLARDAANTLAQRNGTNAQTFNVYNTYTDASNYERLSILGGTTATIRTEAAGTGTAKNLLLQAGGSAVLFLGAGAANQWQISAPGNILANTDNTNDIGASGANRPRSIFAASNITAGGALTAGGAISSSNVVSTGVYVVSALPACASRQGSRAMVTDANATTFNSVVAGSGANILPVYCDGTNWKIGALDLPALLSPANNNNNLIPDGLLRAFG